MTYRISSVYSVIVLLIGAELAACWSDGSPCLRNSMKSMNPLEAEEHQGGLQLTQPPYTLTTEPKCYHPHSMIKVTLSGRDNTTFFRGFALQARLVHPRTNRVSSRRYGKFARDDNGSWRYQCFRFHNGITNSHAEKKNKLSMWWKTDEDRGHRVQFIATVMESMRKFWVQSVVSIPLIPCRLGREYKNYVPKPITRPPPTNWDVFNRHHLSRQSDNNNIFQQTPMVKHRGTTKTTQSIRTRQRTEDGRQHWTPTNRRASRRPQWWVPTTAAAPIPTARMQSGRLNDIEQTRHWRTSQDTTTRRTTTTRAATTSTRTASWQPFISVPPDTSHSFDDCSDLDSALTCAAMGIYCQLSSVIRHSCRKTCNLC